MSKIRRLLFCFLFIGLVTVFFINSQASSQFWEAIPPYNFLWPLWSETLSPPSPITGVPTPIVSELTATTVLPIEPVWGWDIRNGYPGFAFNGPNGLWCWDIVYGLRPFGWPGWALQLPANYQYLVPPFNDIDFAIQANQANLIYTTTASAVFDPLWPFGPYPITPYAELLLPNLLWGTTPWVL